MRMKIPTYEKGVYIKIYDIQGNSFVPKAKQIIIPETTITGSQYTLNSIILSGSSVPGYGASPDIMAMPSPTCMMKVPTIRIPTSCW